MTRKTSAIVGVGHSEHSHQARLINWSRDSSRLQSDPLKRDALRWFHSIPNAAVGRKPFVARDGRKLANLYVLKMIAEGLTKGVLDLRLDYVRRDADRLITSPGLIAEMKKPGEKLSDDQKKYAAFAREQGYEVFVWYDWTKGAIDIANFMQLERFAPVYFEIEPNRFKTICTLEQIQFYGIAGIAG